MIGLLLEQAALAAGDVDVRTPHYAHDKTNQAEFVARIRASGEVRVIVGFDAASEVARRG